MAYTPNSPAANALIFIALILAGLCIVKLRKMNKEISSRPPRKKIVRKIITEREIIRFIHFVRSLSCQEQRSGFVRHFIKNHEEDLKKYHHGWWIFLKNPGNTVYH